MLAPRDTHNRVFDPTAPPSEVEARATVAAVAYSEARNGAEVKNCARDDFEKLTSFVLAAVSCVMSVGRINGIACFASLNTHVMLLLVLLYFLLFDSYVAGGAGVIAVVERQVRRIDANVRRSHARKARNHPQKLRSRASLAFQETPQPPRLRGVVNTYDKMRVFWRLHVVFGKPLVDVELRSKILELYG